MIAWERIQPWDYIVVGVASEYHKKYDMVELQDIKQSLYEWFVEHPNKLDTWESIGEKDAKNLIYRSLRNQALDYCQRWKAKSIGYEVSDLFYYEAGIIEVLLPLVLRKELSVSHKLNMGTPGKPPAPAEGGNLLAMMIEVSAAYNKLNKEDRLVLFYKYAESMDFGDIATEMGISSEDAVRMRHNRAIKKLITRIGGRRPYSDKDTSDEPDELVKQDDYPSEDKWTEPSDSTDE